VTKLPNEPRLAVNLATSTVHKPYTDHAGDNARRSSPDGVRSLLGDADPVLCGICFPSDQPASAPAATKAPEK
jgi:hypothetical protein